MPTSLQPSILTALDSHSQAYTHYIADMRSQARPFAVALDYGHA